MATVLDRNAWTFVLDNDGPILGYPHGDFRAGGRMQDGILDNIADRVGHFFGIAIYKYRFREIFQSDGLSLPYGPRSKVFDDPRSNLAKVYPRIECDRNGVQ